MRASVVIPTLNEARVLPGLLDRLQAQTLRDFEIIVADAGSRDGTRELCRARGVRVTDGGLPGVGRNRGAAIARGEVLFFLDADVLPPADFLACAIDEMRSQGMRLATCWFYPDSDHAIDQLLYELANLFVKLSLRTDPHAGGFAIFVERSLFEAVGGFDERLRVAEDHDFVKRAARIAPLHMLASTSIRVSVRRLVKDGRFSYGAKCIRVELHRLFVGEITEDIVDYQFGYDEPAPDSEAEAALGRLAKRLAQWKGQHAEAVRRLVPGMAVPADLQRRLTELGRSFEQLKESVRALLSR